MLERQPIYVDAEGFKCEVFAAAIHSDGKRLIYLESRFKEISQYVDITIKIHHVNSNGEHFSVDIESYNPYFGCRVELIEWFNQTGFSFVSSIPKIIGQFRSDEVLFEPQSPGTAVDRFFAETGMLFSNLGGEGGLYICIGRRNKT